MKLTLHPFPCLKEYDKAAHSLLCSLPSTAVGCMINWLLVLRTPSGWAERLLTLFADDSHLAFEIETTVDLEQAQRIIRTVFQLFRETGMQVNPTKSRIVLGLRGSAARRWLRKHACKLESKPAVSFGTPSEPLLIPRLHSMVYLGVVASGAALQEFACAAQSTASHSMRAQHPAVRHSCGWRSGGGTPEIGCVRCPLTAQHCSIACPHDT